MGIANELIFISIASYRDIQLIPTMQDLLLKAQEPALLRFGICWQHDPDDPPLPFHNDLQIRVIDVDWRESRGACWARAEIMKLWQGEQYFLQVDSHCRFARHWDTALIRMLAQTGSRKPLLSTYAYPFTPLPTGLPGKEDLSGEAQLMAIETFTADGIPQLKPLPIPGVHQKTQPMRARFLAAGFLFTLGEFIQQVPYDPELYFFGEEISMSLRAFTSGFDLFHPVEQIVWHDYMRTYAVRHWDNHAPGGPRAAEEPSDAPPARPDFQFLDRISRAKIVRLLQPSAAPAESRPPESRLPESRLPSLASQHFGLGTERTLEDYEHYAGISFALRKIQDYTRFAYEPPNPPLPDDWPDRIHRWLVRIVVEPASLPPAAFQDDGFWVVAIQDEEHREIHRRDWTPQEREGITDPAVRNVLLAEMQSGVVPAHWTIWPFSRIRGWLYKIVGTFEDEDFTIVVD